MSGTTTLGSPRPARFTKIAGSAAAVVALAAGSANAVVTYNDNVSPTKPNSEFISGAGIPSDGFVIDTALTGESVALKGRLRDTGQPLLPPFFNRYLVTGGNSVLSPADPSWVFDWQFSPGLTAAPPSSYILTLSVDFDPTPGVADFATIPLAVGDADASPLNSWDDGDGFFVNGAPPFSDTTPYVVSNSWHLGFAFWGRLPFNKTYNPNALGEYEVVLSVTDAAMTPIASTNMFVEVVIPEPSHAAALGLAAMGLLARRRRRS